MIINALGGLTYCELLVKELKKDYKLIACKGTTSSCIII